MGFGPLIILVLLVVVVAYVAGTAAREREARGSRARKPAARTIDAQPRPARGGSPLLASLGDRELQAVVSWLLSQAFEQTGVKVADDKVAYQRIVEAAQKALRQLQSEKSATISLPFLTADASGPKHFETRLTREAFQEIIKY